MATTTLPYLQRRSPAVLERPARAGSQAVVGDQQAGAAPRPPDPKAVQGIDDFLAGLRLLKIWAGDPSFEELRRRCGIPSSTLADALSLKRRSLPRFDLVRRFVQACGLGTADVACWESAWQMLQARDRGVPMLPLKRDAATAMPHQLPRDITRFVGRQDALDRLDLVQAEYAEGRRRSPLVMIVGPEGVGKTALAVRWAHRMVDAYPDGQLYVDLASGVTDRAVSASEVLPSVLQAIGVPEARIPARLAAMVGLYRSLTHAQRLFVLIDGAEGAEQLRPLLPGGPGCFTLLTSRSRLSDLVARDDAVRLTLPPLRPQEALELVASMLGDELGPRDSATLRDLVRRCGYVPLALRGAAQDLADRSKVAAL